MGIMVGENEIIQCDEKGCISNTTEAFTEDKVRDEFPDMTNQAKQMGRIAVQSTREF